MQTKKKILVLACWLFYCGLFLCLTMSAAAESEADPFYIKIFNEGKSHYVAGNYREAVKNFEIAEFGLYDTPQLKEVYIYYALSQFQLGRLEDARKLINNVRNDLGKEGPGELKVPVKIQKAVSAMIAVLDNTGSGTEPGERQKNFQVEVLVLQILEDMVAGKLYAVDQKIAKLEKLNKRDPRILYFKGILAFKQKDFKACVKLLDKIDLSKFDARLMDDLYYHLTLAHYYLGNMKKIGVYYNKILDQKTKHEVYQIIRKDK